jgi:precorrin-6B methylase 1
MADGGHLVLLGYGVADSLQVTVEAQRAIGRATTVYAVTPPPGLVQYLKGLRVKVVDLGEKLSEGSGPAAVLDVADFLLRRAVLEPPAVLFSPGNPLFLNNLARLLLQAANERGVAVTLVPGVSLLDTVISDLGLDVTTRGLQVFDARHLLGLRHQPNPRVPLLVLEVGALAQGFEGAQPQDVFAGFAAYLGGFYPAAHAVTLITESTGRGAFARRTVTMEQLGELLPIAGVDSVLFLDIVPRQ